ncbi:hypothetical protein HY949_02145 [Candidatus Gottesmanbacteria bacterium]|nr:hypothetical protein [Candidatus Gottesmanbacteria bacterium]
MNKKIALVKLIRNSFIIPNEDKLVILGKIEQMKDEDVEELGKFLAEEHDFIIKHEAGLRGNVGEIMETLKSWKPPDKVYVGTGRAG